MRPCHARVQIAVAETGVGLWFGFDHPGAVVRVGFRYFRDPLFLGSCAAYALNRWLLKPHLDSTFLHSYFNDALLIPCALPLALLLQRWLRLRSHDRRPQLGEIALHLCAWSILFEWIGPHLMKRATGDPWDVAAYVAGGVLAGLWWRWQQHQTDGRFVSP